MKSENLPSFCLLVGYSGYKALPYSLHSVQTRRDKKSGPSLRENIPLGCLVTNGSHSFFT